MPQAIPQESLQAVTKQDRQRIADQIAEAQQNLISISYDKAATYTAVIIFGGYAGFFAIWQLSKEYLSKQQTLGSALLILVSMLSFVLFEVYKMIFVTRSILTHAKTIENPSVRDDPQKLLAALQAMGKAHAPSSRLFISVWAVTVAVALIGALGGTGILAYAFIRGLMS